jgi:NADPH:quinone reductase-like Zn-dependent oxidoreductase
MKAIVQDRYGSSDVLRFEDVQRPVPGEDEVLVRVRAAAVNAADWHIMRGDPYLARLALGLRRPKARIRGRDFAGTVEAVGARVTRFAPGDDVFGEVDGTFAEFVTVGDNAVEHKPANLTFEEAAALPLAGVTALIGLRELADVQPGHRVLVIGASGGVGPYAVQLATAAGAEVTAVCSTRNVDLVRSLGADHVIDYTRDQIPQDARFHVVLDLVAKRPLGALRAMATPTGTIILSGGGTSDGGSFFGPMALLIRGALTAKLVRRQRIHQLVATPTRARLTTLRELAESATLRPLIERTYPLAEAPTAIRHLEKDHARTKIVITI